MKAVNPNSEGRNFVVWHFKIAGAAIALALQFQIANAEILSTPKGLDVFPIVLPPVKSLQILWTYPTELETSDTIFKLYHSRNLSLPLEKWSVLTNIPGQARRAIVSATLPMEFFVLTVSNYQGESGYATR